MECHGSRCAAVEEAGDLVAVDSPFVAEVGEEGLDGLFGFHMIRRCGWTVSKWS